MTVCSPSTVSRANDESIYLIAKRMKTVNHNWKPCLWLLILLQLNEVDNAAAMEKEPEFGLHLDIASPGDISSFFWAHSQAPPPGLVECDVAYGEQTCQGLQKIWLCGPCHCMVLL